MWAEIKEWIDSDVVAVIALGIIIWQTNSNQRAERRRLRHEWRQRRLDDLRSNMAQFSALHTQCTLLSQKLAFYDNVTETKEGPLQDLYFDKSDGVARQLESAIELRTEAEIRVILFLDEEKPIENDLLKAITDARPTDFTNWTPKHEAFGHMMDCSKKVLRHWENEQEL